MTAELLGQLQLLWARQNSIVQSLDVLGVSQEVIDAALVARTLIEQAQAEL